MNHRDHEARTAEITDIDPPDDDTLRAARLMTCANSDNREEAELFMHMLGIHPDQEGESIYATATPNLPNSAGSHVTHPLTSNVPRIADLRNPNSVYSTPPRILNTPMLRAKRRGGN